ncbi:MAG TPA: endonuclease MutS2, partial [Chloroflexota bacterium]|nr:endonuclease MutS2 [Chloroflexota bacterium]
DKVRERLAERTAFAASRELALELVPTASRRLIQRGLDETTEAKRLLDLQPEFSVRSAHDVREAARNARIGATLDPEVLVDVRDTLESGAYVRNVLSRHRDACPILADVAGTIDPCPIVVRAVRDAIGERGEVLDSASPELGKIRSQLKVAYNRMMDALQRIMDAAGARGQLQEAIITSRGGRYVLPVRAEARNQFRGIVHDESGSGATVFMEPLAAVELNNEWRHLQLEEEKEVERVLRHLSALVGQHEERIVAGVNAIASIDVALAKAKLAHSQRAAAPVLESGYRLNLVHARHPLLTGNVVPTDIHLGLFGDVVPTSSENPLDKEFLALVITGPNTGGKTVALKTVGLLQLMAQAGLHIPAEEGSSVAVFEEVYADIGDEQSIEQSLSTFSSHMRNIVSILERADERSLVLLDELGAGTDPQEGSALARAILSYLVDRRICTVATTHYSELKAYAYQTPGVQNASVEFDVESLRPTYRLMIGLPGRSNALSIAQRLGLPDHIRDAARAHLAPEQSQIEDMLKAIQAERDAARDERLAAARLREEAEAQRNEAQRRIERLEDDRQATVERAQREAEHILEEARQQIRRAEQQVAAAGGDRMAVLRAARDVQQAAHEIGARPRGRHRPEAEPEERPLAVGDRVEVRRLNAVGQVLTPPNERGEVEVQLGGLRTRASVRDLTRVTRREAEQRAPSRAEPRVTVSAAPRDASVPAPASVRMELDVRGTRADDVLPRVERYLSDAYLAGMPFVRIIHGKGTGVLRQIIRDSLASNPMVQSYEAASNNDGGEGATIVRLAV